jgi:alkylhydroperoxidase/carboxymuconolactone decarboxylase family protein YurZ
MGDWCDESMPATAAPEAMMLDAKTIALVRLASAIARGGESLLRDRMRAARGAQIPNLWVDELLLQSMLNVGYPLALAAYGVWRDVAGPLKETVEPVVHANWHWWEKRGEEACALVYGRAYHKLLLNLRGLHPAIEPLVVIDAYGKILGRPGLDAKLRELCTLAAIAMLDAPQQLNAHFRGALNTGATREEVDAVLAVVESDLGADRALKVWEAWASVRERKLDEPTRKPGT